MVSVRREERGPKVMQKGAHLDLRATPEAKVALDMLRAQATRGPYVHPHNAGAAPLRSGADVARNLPLSDGGRVVYGRAIDAWLAAGGTTPFQSPMRLAPADEARIHDGMAELCRQRHLAHTHAMGPHPTLVAAAGLEAAFQRGRKKKDMPKSIGHRSDQMAKDQKIWARAKRLAARQGQEGNDAYVSAVFHNMRGDRLHKVHRLALTALAAVRRAAPTDGLCALAARRGQPVTSRLAKRGELPEVAQLDRLAQAIARLRQDQLTAMRPSGEGLKALLSATGRMDRQDRIARAEGELRRSRTAATRQGRIDLCLLAQADAILALGGL